MHLDDAIGVLRNGDGNDNAAPVFAVGDGVIGGTAGSLSYANLLAFWNEFDPYTMLLDRRAGAGAGEEYNPAFDPDRFMKLKEAGR